MEIQLKDREEALVTAQRLFAKGFVTVADVKKEELSVLTVTDQLRQAETDLKVLVEFTYAKNVSQQKSNVAQAEQKLERTRRENASNLSKLTAALTAQDQQLTLRKQLHVKLEEQLKNCTILAPADGLVVFYSSMDRDRDPLKEGATVRNQQVLIRLPDTSTMKAVVRVPEGQVAKLRVDDNNPMRATVDVVGFKLPFGASVAKISVLADSGSRWMNPDLKEYPVELLLDETPANCKPGMSAQVEIMIDRRPKVVAIPLTALYSVGYQTFVFVRDGANPKPIEVKVGAVNDTMAEIREGLAAGQDVLLLQPGQGRTLLEKAGIKTQPATRPGDRPGGRRRPQNGANNGQQNPSQPNKRDENAPRRDEGAPKREADSASKQQQDSALPASQPTAIVPVN
jgi:multidrug efflux pump subunit AcrA (membrane-fusion protein)